MPKTKAKKSASKSTKTTVSTTTKPKAAPKKEVVDATPIVVTKPTKRLFEVEFNCPYSKGNKMLVEAESVTAARISLATIFSKYEYIRLQVDGHDAVILSASLEITNGQLYKKV